MCDRCSVNIDGFEWMINSHSVVSHENSSRSGYDHKTCSGMCKLPQWGQLKRSIDINRMNSTKTDVIKNYSGGIAVFLPLSAYLCEMWHSLPLSPAGL